VHAAADLMVKEAKWEEESHQQKKEQDSERKAEAEETARLEEEQIARRVESQRMNKAVSFIIVLWSLESDDF